MTFAFGVIAVIAQRGNFVGGPENDPRLGAGTDRKALKASAHQVLYAAARFGRTSLTSFQDIRHQLSWQTIGGGVQVAEPLFYRCAKMLAYRNANRAIGRLRAFGGSSSFSRPRRTHFIVHGKNHVNIMREAARLVRVSGHEIAFVPITGSRGGDLALAYAHELGFPTLTLDELARQSVAGDLICCGCDWSPRNYKSLLSAKQREGVTLVGIIEGARFSPRQFQRVDYILAWGPSSERLWPQPTIVTGSPVFERSLSHRVDQKPSPPRALINYKFQQHESDLQFAWARAAMAAASLIDRQHLVSVHPAVKVTPVGMPISQENIDKLLAEASVVITRASTIIHQALALGTTVIFAPTVEENRAEFRDLQGIIHVAESEYDLMQLAREFAAKGCLEGVDPRSFIEHHFSIDPEKSADERMADALLKLLRC